LVQSTEKNTYVSPGDFALFRGGRLPHLEMAYETWGRLNEDKSNGVLLLPGLSPNAHAKASAQDVTAGWWESMIGPGLAIDTDQYFVICVNHLGSCFGSTGPASMDPKSGLTYGLGFPELSLEDLASAANLVVRHLGIQKLHAVIGPSMGGLAALAYSILFPDQLRKLSLISSGLRPQAQAIAVHSLQREAIRGDAKWKNGFYSADQRPLQGMRLALKIGMTSYRSAAELETRFGNDRTDLSTAPPFGIEFQVESYLEASAHKFVERFDANCYLYLSRAMDLFDPRDHGDTLEEALSKIGAQAIQVLGVESDALFPLQQQNELADALEAAELAVQFVALNSQKGHDAFLVESDLFTPVLSEFLS
jgi:homoserine O-acetyltransferase